MSHAPFLADDDRRMPLPGEELLTHPGYAPWSGIAPLPHPRLMVHVGAESVENFLVVGDAWGQLIASLLKPQARVLDIGCGCGRTARTLLHHPHVADYLGFDVVPAYPAWCNHHLSPLTAGRFRFEHLDVHTPRYNPEGRIAGAEAVFPVESSSVTLAFAGSLFTHLREPDAVRYLAETRRALAPGGLLVASTHDHMPENGGWSGDEHRADVAPAHFVALAAAQGLTHQRTIADVCGQRTFLFEA